MGVGATTEQLKRAVLKSAPEDCGHAQTYVSGVSVMRFDAPSGILHEIYTPVLCLVLQGTKQVALGEAVRDFGAGRGLLVNVQVPVVSRVTCASRDKPYLALALKLDLPLLHELADQVAPVKFQSVEAGPLLVLDEVEDALIDCATRLIGLAERPEAMPILRPGIVREMHYLLLSGRLGATLRRLSPPDSHTQRVARAITLLRSGFARPLAVETLAAASGMSPSSFYQHFKAVTSYSPLQFQKRLRLLEARRMMMSEGVTARRAAFAVGYESTSQFTRDYAKRFGMPPRRETRAMRSTTPETAVTEVIGHLPEPEDGCGECRGHGLEVVGVVGGIGQDDLDGQTLGRGRCRRHAKPYEITQAQYDDQRMNGRITTGYKR